jgi:hypothetical protein
MSIWTNWPRRPLRISLPILRTGWLEDIALSLHVHHAVAFDRLDHAAEVEISDSVDVPNKVFSQAFRPNSAGVAHCNAEWGRVSL